MPTRRRTPLSRDAVVRAALRVAEKEGLEGLTVSRIGDELGVTGMAIYNHVDDKASLLDAMADTIIKEMAVEVADGLPWDRALRDIAIAFRDGLLRYPHTAPLVLTRRLNAPASLPLVDAALGVLRDAGFDAATSVRVLRALIAFLIGSITREVSLGATSGPEPAVAAGDGPFPYPNIAACADELAVIDHEEELRAGLNLLLGALRPPRMD